MATFKFRCVFCRQKIEAQDEWDGMFAECPSCGKRIEVRRDDEFTTKPPPLPMPEPVTMPMERIREEEPPAPPAPDTPKPFPKPFTIDLPKWELPGKDGTKK